MAICSLGTRGDERRTNVSRQLLFEAFGTLSTGLHPALLLKIHLSMKGQFN